MARLLRPYIPISVRIVVARRQLADIGICTLVSADLDTVGMNAPARLAVYLQRAFGASDVDLDHDPALGARRKIMRNGEIVGYDPDANDPDFLIYREGAAHQIKTNVRGEHGQHPDRVLIKKNRRLEEREGVRPVKRGVGFSQKVKSKSSQKPWPSRPLRSRNTFERKK